MKFTSMAPSLIPPRLLASRTCASSLPVLLVLLRWCAFRTALIRFFVAAKHMTQKLGGGYEATTGRPNEYRHPARMCGGVQIPAAIHRLCPAKERTALGAGKYD